MNSRYSLYVVVTGIVLTLRVGPSWGGPPNPTPSDGNGNTAGGTNALVNTTGILNTASGFAALLLNTTGNDNTASGLLALASNIVGGQNTAIGASALFSDQGISNTALGFAALGSNTLGGNNTALGVNALRSNTTGILNTALGFLALGSNITGNANIALGSNALFSNISGGGNLAVGNFAGSNLVSGDTNIYIGNPGAAATESDTLRLGNTQTSTFIAGIAGTPVTGSIVVIDSNGQLGIVTSSARYKRDIQTMGKRSDGLLKLRPVTFRYKQDPQGQRQYGLIAEEVARVYPELVTKGAKGEVESVQYHELIPMLLNEMQHQQHKLEHQQQELAEVRAQNARLEAVLGQMQTQVAALVALTAQGQESPKAFRPVGLRTE